MNTHGHVFLFPIFLLNQLQSNGAHCFHTSKEYNVVGILENFFTHMLYIKYILFLNGITVLFNYALFL